MKSNPFLLIVLTLAALCGILQGCGSNQVVYNHTKPKMRFATFASLSPDASELGPYLGLRMIGRTGSDTDQMDQNIPVVVETKPNYELLASLKPDLILYDPSLFSSADIQKIKQLGFPSYAITGNTVAQYIRCLYKLGSLVHNEMQISDLVDQIYAQVDKSKGDPFTQPHHVALLMTIPNANPMIAGTGSFYADLVRVAGGTPVGPSDDKFTTIDAEHLLSLNPDCIIIAGTPQDSAAFAKDPRYSHLKAIQDHHFFSIRSSYVLRRGSMVPAAIKALHRALGQVIRGSN